MKVGIPILMKQTKSYYSEKKRDLKLLLNR